MGRRIPEQPESIEPILARVQTPFLEKALADPPEWVRNQPGLSLDVQGRSRHMV